jgi:hypothetical protein
MISESFTDIGVSKSWLRKLLPGYLKSTKHTRKDYLKLQHQRDQQPLQQQQQKELVELPSLSSRHSVSEQQQPSDDDDEQTASVTTYDNDNVLAVKPQTQDKQMAVLEDKDSIIKNLETKIEELQVEIRYLHDGPAAQQQQEEETFTALEYIQLSGNDVPIKVTVNVKTKSIEDMKIAHEIIHNAKTYQ